MLFCFVLICFVLFESIFSLDKKEDFLVPKPVFEMQSEFDAAEISQASLYISAHIEDLKKYPFLLSVAQNLANNKEIQVWNTYLPPFTNRISIVVFHL
jgi:hypothetical protein